MHRGAQREQVVMGEMDGFRLLDLVNAALRLIKPSVPQQEVLFASHMQPEVDGCSAAIAVKRSFEVDV